MGFATKTDSRIFSREGYLAGTDASRAAQFNAMVADNKVQAVMCARGGYGSLRMLDALDYAAIGSTAKALIGFSDITALHRAILLRSSLVTLHGPMVTTLSRCDEESRISWYRALTESAVPSLDLSRTRVLKDGNAEGVLAGGNLATLCHLTGTSLGRGFEGQILLLEEIGETPYRIDRMLTQMKMAGLFAGLAGLVLGSFEDCGAVDEIDALVQERFADVSIPIVSGVCVGHGRSNWTVPLGVAVRLDTVAGELRFLEPTFRE
jgi:muramoyltetrapeptide carboxypeptidase